MFLLVCLTRGALGSSPAGHPGAENYAAANLPSQVPPLRVVAFYSSTCQHCEKAKKALAESERRWGSRVRVEKRDVARLACQAVFFVSKKAGLRSATQPAANA